jgi:hypothetical protein
VENGGITRRLTGGITLTEMLLRHEPLIRAGAFACMLLTVALWEVIATRRPQRIHRRLRWPSNLAIVALGTLVTLLGAPALAVLIFEVLLNATSMFNHGNIRQPTRVDHWLRLVVVTPDMHRVHHSIVRQETDSNFGFNLPWWDRLFGTYRDQPAAGHLGMTIGIEAFRSAHDLRLDRMLLQPLVKENGANGRG